MKYCLAVLLLLLFSLQVLPVKKMGKLLGKVQGTEQVQSDSDSDDEDLSSVSLCNTDIIVPPFSFGIPTGNCYFENKVAILIHITEVLPIVNMQQIPSPPPEC